jgi:stage II sporulation protein AA (anti-sigma F factor antagonist)
MPLFSLEIVAQSAGTRAVLAGEIDMSTVDELRSRLEAALLDSPAILVLDLSGVTFLDSSGLRLVLQIDAAAKRAGGRLIVVPGPRLVSRVFELTGAADELEIAPAGTDPLADHD